MSSDRSSIKTGTPGLLISFEGIDGCGKSTHARMLVDHLNTGPSSELLPRAVYMSFPDRTTPSGQRIDAHLKGTDPVDDPDELYELFVENRAEKQYAIKRELARGVVVVLDRYIHSGVAYSVATGGLDMAECFEEEDEFVKPDLTFLLISGVDAALERIKARETAPTTKDESKSDMETDQQVDLPTDPPTVAADASASESSGSESSGSGDPAPSEIYDRADVLRKVEQAFYDVVLSQPKEWDTLVVSYNTDKADLPTTQAFIVRYVKAMLANRARRVSRKRKSMSDSSDDDSADDEDGGPVNNCKHALVAMGIQLIILLIATAGLFLPSYTPSGGS